jgi:hypothetical protein
MHDLALVACLFGPLFVGLIFHGLCIKFGWLRFAAVPIDGGALLCGRPLFGPTKTFRGALAVALGAAAGYAFRARGRSFSLRPRVIPTLCVASLGFALGGAAMLCEFLHSLLKRQLDIAPGASGRGRATALCYPLDPSCWGLARRMAVGLSDADSGPWVGSLPRGRSPVHQQPWCPSWHAGLQPGRGRRLTAAGGRGLRHAKRSAVGRSAR